MRRCRMEHIRIISAQRHWYMKMSWRWKEKTRKVWWIMDVVLTVFYHHICCPTNPWAAVHRRSVLDERRSRGPNRHTFGRPRSFMAFQSAPLCTQWKGASPVCPRRIHLHRFQHVIATRGFLPLIRIPSSTRARSYKSKTDLVTKPGYSTKRQAFGNSIGIELMLRIWIDSFEKIESENSRSSCLGSARLYRCPFLAKKISFCGHWSFRLE